MAGNLAPGSGPGARRFIHLSVKRGVTLGVPGRVKSMRRTFCSLRRKQPPADVPCLLPCLYPRGVHQNTLPFL